MPKSKSGKWSFWLIVAMPVLFFAGSTAASFLYRSTPPASNTIIEDLTARPLLSFSMLAGMICGISAFITGLIAFIKQKERALLIYLPIVIGAFLIVFLIGEILFPH